VNDAFGIEIFLGSKVLGITNTSDSQTFYIGKIINFLGNLAIVELEKASNLYIEESKEIEKQLRTCLCDRLVKL